MISPKYSAIFLEFRYSLLKFSAPLSLSAFTKIPFWKGRQYWFELSQRGKSGWVYLENLYIIFFFNMYLERK